MNLFLMIWQGVHLLYRLKIDEERAIHTGKDFPRQQGFPFRHGAADEERGFLEEVNALVIPFRFNQGDFLRHHHPQFLIRI